ncbi:ComEA family DNA-binding protein [Burkholderiaceae bacterium UC74_6]
MLLALSSGVSSQAQIAEVEANTANQGQLESLPGVGPALAERLLKARPLSGWVDLQARVKGVSPATARQLSGDGLRVQGQPYMSDVTQSR